MPQVYDPPTAVGDGRTGCLGVPRMRVRLTRLLALVAVAALACTASARAQAVDSLVRYTGTLKKVQDSGVVMLGYRENSPPFAFRDDAGKPIGYALDLCEVVVEEIGREL